MKVAVAGAATVSDWGGGEPQFARRLGEGLRSRGVEVTRVPSARGLSRMLSMGSYPGGWDLVNESAFRRALRQIHPDIVLGFYDYDASLLRATIQLDIPLVQVVQVYWPVCPIGTLYIEGEGICEGAGFAKCLRHIGKAAPRTRLPHLPQTSLPAPIAGPLYFKFKSTSRALGACAHIIVPSDAMQRYFAERGLENVVAIKVGIPLDEISPGEADPDRRIVLFNSGSPIERKGLPHFLRIAEELSPRWPSVVFQSTSYRPDQSTTGSRYLTRTELISLLRRSYLCVLPVLWMEPFPAAALEAMAAAKPVVTYDTGGMAEIVDDGVTGLLVPRGDVVGLRSAVETLLADESLARRMGEAGRRKAEREFGFEQMRDRILELLIADVEDAA